MPNTWKIFAAKTLVIENRFVPIIKKAIFTYRSSFINDLTAAGQSAAIANLPPVNSSIAPIIQTIYQTAGLFGARFQWAELKAVPKRAGTKDAGFGKNQDWVNQVMEYLKVHLLNFVTDITNTMRQDIINTLSKAAENGWSIERTVQELQRSDLVESRARVIARTEIIRAANVGHKVAASSYPYEVDKKWSAASDHRTRHSHRDVNGHIVGENDNFKVPKYSGDNFEGYEEMEGPGDPNATPGNTINCRCRRIYIPKRDDQGKLILRSSNTATIIPMRGVNTIPAHQIAATLKASTRITVE